MIIRQEPYWVIRLQREGNTSADLSNDNNCKHLLNVCQVRYGVLHVGLQIKQTNKQKPEASSWQLAKLKLGPKKSDTSTQIAPPLLHSLSQKGSEGCQAQHRYSLNTSSQH